jgi:hypothetical protein
MSKQNVKLSLTDELKARATAAAKAKALPLAVFVRLSIVEAVNRFEREVK